MKKALIVIATLFVFTHQALAAPRPIAAGAYKITMPNVRNGSCFPAMPNYSKDLTVAGGAEPVHVSRHHIIPYNLLRDFYNRALQEKALPKLRGLFLTLRENLRDYASAGNCAVNADDLAGTANLIDMIINGTVTNNPAAAFPDYFDDFASFYAWLPGNLFIGPTNRNDDPEDEFEARAGVVVGDNFSLYERANKNMKSYVATGDASLLLSINSDLTSIAKKKSVYPLDGHNWNLSREGHYVLR